MRSGDPVVVGEFESVQALRHYMARELHDEVAEPLVGLVVQLEELKRSSFGNGVTQELMAIQESMRQVLRSTREMLVDLRDQGSLRLNFAAALKDELLPRFQSDGQVVTIQVSPDWPAEIGGWAAFNIYRIIQEALANAHRHSRAKRVDISLWISSEGMAVLRVVDDGRGLEGTAPSLGTLGMRERAVILGGTMKVVSNEQRGTTVEVSFPAHRLQ